MNIDNRFIGSGMIFPINIDSAGRPEIITGLRLLRSSILSILSWPYRTRFFNENYGSRIEETLEEPNDSISSTLLRHFVMESLEKWEKRIIVKGVEVIDRQDTVIHIRVVYHVRNTKIEDTFIFPFYKEIIY